MVLSLILAVFFCGLMPSECIAASALRSRVYGFRHTDNKLAIQLANQLELKVTIDMHSPSVAVLTGTDSLELVRAYSLMEIADRKEPVSLKVLGSVSDSEAEETLKQLQKQLGGLNVGTFLDPPTKSVANPFIVDVYQGSLIVIGAAGEMEKAEAAYKAYQAKRKASSPKAEPSEPNVPPLAAVKASEPNTAQAVSLAVPQIQPVTPAAEPNAAETMPSLPQLAAAVEEAIEMAAPEEIKPAAEPNQAKPEEPQSQEDFMSSELLKSLAAEEKSAQNTPTAAVETSKTKAVEEVKTETASPAESKAEPVKEAQAAAVETPKAEAVEEAKTEAALPVESKTEPVKEATAQAEQSPDRPALPGTVRIGKAVPVKAPITQSPQPVDANAVKQSAGETKEVDIKQVIEQLMKQSTEEEKKALQEAATAEAEAAEKQAGAAEETKKIEAVTAEQPVTQKATPAETTAEKPAETPAQPKPEKPAATPTKPKDTSGEQKVKTAGAESAVPQGEEELELTITLPEKVEIKQLIELVGKQLGLNYIYDENKVRGDVMLKVHDGKIKVKDCYALLETVLRFKGFVMTRRGNLVTIVPSTELPASDPKIRTAGEPIEPGDVIINSIYALKHINYNTAMNLLRQLSLGTSIIPIVETNTLIITDYSYRMDKIEKVIQILDVPGVPKTYTYRSLQYMQAADLIPRLQKLAAQLENLSITVSTSSAPSVPAGAPMRIDPRTQQPIPMSVPQPSATPQSAAQQAQSVFLEADERTNRILMIGSEDQLKTVNGLIDSLDVRQYNLRYVKEYEIKYVDALEVINVLNELSLVQIATPQSSGQTGRSTAQAVPQRPGMPPQPQQPQPQQMVQRSAAAGAGAAEGIDQPSVSIRPNTNSLLVNATEEQHEDIQLVIQYIDVEQKDQRTIKEYEIQNVDVQEIVQTLGDLGIISKQSVANITTSKSSMYSGASSGGFGTSRMSGGMTNRVTGMPMDQGAQEQTAVASLLTAEGGTIKELITTEPQMSILESTNSLLIHATPRQHASIALVIAHVDRELDRISTPYVIYPLENQKPEELAATLMDLIEGSMSKTSISPSPGMGPSPGNKIQTEQTGVSNLPKKEEERIRIIADDASNALVVYANKKNQQWVATLIKELDQYRPQVLLDCTLVKITQDESFNYDLDIIGKTYGGATMRGMTAGTTPTAIVGSQANFAQDSFIDARSTSGTGKVFFNSDRVQALLDVIETKGYGRVMSRPKILVNDNEEGNIKTKNTIPIAEVKVITTPYSTGTGTSSTTSNNVEFKDYEAGVELKIKPHISKGNMLRLEITLNKTLFKLNPAVELIIDGVKNSYPSPPDRVSTDVVSIATVPDGSTIVLGGLEEIDQTKDSSKVPILGDLPIVGGLFRKIDNTGSQDRLYVFVKANVIRPSDQIEGLKDIKRVSDKYRESFEDMEQKFQKMQSWPGIKSKPMDPEKVLEDDEYIQRLRERQAEKEAAAAQELQEEPVN
jgi:type II secretory pathway component GspD/PulD (secretin)